MQRKNDLKINSESINIDFFREGAKFILKRNKVKGFILGMAGMLTAFGVASSIDDRIPKDEVVVSTVENSDIQNMDYSDADKALIGFDIGIDYTLLEPYEIGLDEINSLNIIINDNKFSGNTFNEICEELHKDGIRFTETESCEGVDVNNAVVITLDQLYLSGPGMVIFAPNDNERLGDSDALALAMEAGFKENGFEVDAVNAGKIGYKETKMGGFQSRVPTSTENSIGTDKNTSFVTISFGTNNFSAKEVADSVENALARYVYYQREKVLGEDLIYRIQGGDLMAKLEERFDGSSSREILDYNDIESENRIPMDQTVKNPAIKNMMSFKDDSLITLNVNKGNTY